MQDFRKYDYTVTAAQLEEIAKEQDIIVIINGEYYDFKPTKDSETTVKPQ